jgi:hypothetical protein
MLKKPTPKITELYPNLTEQQLKQAEDNLEHYLLVVLRIFERIELGTVEKSTQLTPPNSTLSYLPQESESPKQSP